MFERNRGSVSYTHLDVYKRQPFPYSNVLAQVGVERGLLCGLEFPIALGGEVEQHAELVAAEWAMFGGALNLNEFAGSGHCDVHVGHCAAVFDVRQVLSLIHIFSARSFGSMFEM